jgi:hypothetical protein
MVGRPPRRYSGDRRFYRTERSLQVDRTANGSKWPKIAGCGRFYAKHLIDINNVGHLRSARSVIAGRTSPSS